MVGAGPSGGADPGVAVESSRKATGAWRQQDVDLAPAAATDTTVSAYYDYPWCARAGPGPARPQPVIAIFCGRGPSKGGCTTGGR